MKIITVIGARPQFIKAAAVSNVLRLEHHEVMIHTGQHYDDNMSKIFFDELKIPQPDYHLNVGSGNHGKQTGQMLEKIEEILLAEKPDGVLVYGDTNSTLAGALAASKLLIPVAHIEAGLRSFNKAMPEEQNRIVTDHLSKLLFAPTETAMRNLHHEGLAEQAYHTGDVMYDAMLHFSKLAEQNLEILDQHGLVSGKFILVTIHRAENTNDIDRLKSIVEALNECGQSIVLPMHPRTRKFIADYKLSFSEHVKLIDPIGYLDTIRLEKHCAKLVTDSGGCQKEAFFMNKPCITMRDETEWVETVENGWNVIVGADKTKILSAIEEFVPTQPKINHFGEGDAGAKIVAHLGKLLQR